jgi:hypothetical protein
MWRIIVQNFILPPAYLCWKSWRRLEALVMKYELEGVDLYYIIPEPLFKKLYA